MNTKMMTLAAAVGLIDRFMGDYDSPIERVDIRIENSPWVSFDLTLWLRGTYRFALWRSSGDVFHVIDGAVGDDPVPSLDWVLRKEKEKEEAG